MTEPVTGDAEIRPGEKFCEDALSETCEALRVELGLAKNLINEKNEAITRMQNVINTLDAENRKLKSDPFVEVTDLRQQLDVARDKAGKLFEQLGGSIQK